MASTGARRCGSLPHAVAAKSLQTVELKSMSTAMVGVLEMHVCVCKTSCVFDFPDQGGMKQRSE
jgi:hypothetical protein